MCLLVFAWKVQPEYDLILAANRDEFLNRPARAATFWDEYPELLAGMDIIGGGTWLGVTLDGKFSAITNYRDMTIHKPDAPTRGHLPLDYLKGVKAPMAYIDSIRSDADRFNGFNLILGDKNSIWYYSNIEDVPRELGPGIYGLSNHLLNSPWPKVERAKEGLEAIIGSGKPDQETLFGILSDRTPAQDNQLPETGLDKATEKKLSSAFIEMDGYGTRSSTVIMLDKSGQLEFREKVNRIGNTIPSENTYFRYLIKD
jgi:uncharacterized protein with NRDE domain